MAKAYIILIKKFFITSLITVLLFGWQHQVSAQANLSAYVDQFNKFYSFDNGIINELEYLAPREYKIGRTGICYLDNLGIFKVYRYGITNKVNTNFTRDFGVTDNFIYYRTQTTLHLIEGDEDLELCRWVGQYGVGDSVVMYYDRVRNLLIGYYNGKKYELETNLSAIDSNMVSDFKVSDNIIAYSNFMSQFKVFHSGEVHELEGQPVRNYQIGRNTCAYVDVNGEFKIYQNGIKQTIEAFPPKRYLVGDNVVAWLGYNGYFNIFYNGKVQQIGYFDKNFNISDFVVTFEDGSGFFKVFYQGEIYELDNFYPSSILSNYRSCCYVNRAGTLRMFHDGKIYDVTSMPLRFDAVRLDYDVLQYRVGNNMFRFFSEGKDQ